MADLEHPCDVIRIQLTKHTSFAMRSFLPLLFALALDAPAVDGDLEDEFACGAAEQGDKEPQYHLGMMYLRADRATPHEKGVEILAVAQRAGVMKIAFVTEAAK